MKNEELNYASLSEKETEMVTGGILKETTILGRVNGLLAAQKGGASLMGSVVDGLGDESLDIVDIVSRVEEEFKLRIPEEDFCNFKSAESITEYVEKRLNKR